MSTTDKRLLWMAACVAAVVYAVRVDGLASAALCGAAAGFCFRQAA